MAESQRYYWLKLQENFFSNPLIAKLRRIAGGDTYTLIYIKMLLLSLPTGGWLTYKGVEPTFAAEMALEIAEKPNHVAEAISLLSAYGLVLQNSNTDYFLPYVEWQERAPDEFLPPQIDTNRRRWGCDI